MSLKLYLYNISVINYFAVSYTQKPTSKSVNDKAVILWISLFELTPLNVLE